MQLRFTGTGNVANVSMSRVVLNASTDGFADLTAGYDVDLKLVGLSGSLQGFVDGPSRQFGATADLKVRVVGFDAVGQRAALSNKGIGACYEVLGASFYAGYKFGQPIPAGVRAGATLGDCNLSEFDGASARPGHGRHRRGVRPSRSAPARASQNVELNAAAGTPDRDPHGTRRQHRHPRRREGSRIGHGARRGPHDATRPPARSSSCGIPSPGPGPSCPRRVRRRSPPR